jgi:hypothetical protein
MTEQEHVWKFYLVVPMSQHKSLTKGFEPSAYKINFGAEWLHFTGGPVV